MSPSAAGQPVLRETRVASGRVELVFIVELTDGPSRRATVPILQGGRPMFPHVMSDAGETLGNATLDAAVRDAAVQLIAARRDLHASSFVSRTAGDLR